MKRLKPNRKNISIALLLLSWLCMNPHLGKIYAQTSAELENLLIKAASNGNLDKVNELISSGVNVNAKKDNGTTALIAASFSGHTETVKVLVALGADMQAVTDDGGSALIVASFGGHTETVKALITLGANVNEKHNKYGTTVLMYASLKNHLETTKELISKNAELNAVDNEGVTALMAATEQGHADIVKELIRNNAKIDMQNKNGITALIHAVDKNHTEICRELINQGADPNLKDKYGMTALMYAAQNGATEITKLLIDKGAYLNTKNNQGRTALSIAFTNPNSDITFILLEAGAKDEHVQEFKIDENGNYIPVNNDSKSTSLKSSALNKSYSNSKHELNVVKEIFVKNSLPINVTDSPETIVIAGDEKSELYIATLLGKFIMIERQVPWTYSGGTLLLAKPVDEEIIKNISDRLDCKVFNAGLHRKFILLSEDYPIHVVPVDELELSEIGSALFQLNEYKATIDYLEQAKKIEGSGVWQSSYPYLSAAYWLNGEKELSKKNLDQMIKESQKSYGYLSIKNATTRKYLLNALQEVMKSIPEDEIEYWNRIVLRIENL